MFQVSAFILETYLRQYFKILLVSMDCLATSNFFSAEAGQYSQECTNQPIYEALCFIFVSGLFLRNYFLILL